MIATDPLFQTERELIETATNDYACNVKRPQSELLMRGYMLAVALEAAIAFKPRPRCAFLAAGAALSRVRDDIIDAPLPRDYDHERQQRMDVEDLRRLETKP